VVPSFVIDMYEEERFRCVDFEELKVRVFAYIEAWGKVVGKRPSEIYHNPRTGYSVFRGVLKRLDALERRIRDEVKGFRT